MLPTAGLAIGDSAKQRRSSRAASALAAAAPGDINNSDEDDLNHEPRSETILQSHGAKWQLGSCLNVTCFCVSELVCGVLHAPDKESPTTLAPCTNSTVDSKDGGVFFICTTCNSKKRANSAFASANGQVSGTGVFVAVVDAIDRSRPRITAFISVDHYDALESQVSEASDQHSKSTSGKKSEKTFEISTFVYDAFVNTGSPAHLNHWHPDGAGGARLLADKLCSKQPAFQLNRRGRTKGGGDNTEDGAGAGGSSNSGGSNGPLDEAPIDQGVQGSASQLPKDSNAGAGGGGGGRSNAGAGGGGGGGSSGDESDDTNSHKSRSDDSSGEDSSDEEDERELYQVTIGEMKEGNTFYSARKGDTTHWILDDETTYTPGMGDEESTRFRLTYTGDGAVKRRKMRNIYILKLPPADGANPGSGRDLDQADDISAASAVRKEQIAKRNREALKERQRKANEAEKAQVQGQLRRAEAEIERLKHANQAQQGEESTKYGTNLYGIRPKPNGSGARDVLNHPRCLTSRPKELHLELGLRYVFEVIGHIPVDQEDMKLGIDGRMPTFSHTWECRTPQDLLDYASTTFTINDEKNLSDQLHMPRIILPHMVCVKPKGKGNRDGTDGGKVGELKDKHDFEEGGTFEETRKVARDNGHKLKFKRLNIDSLLEAAFADRQSSFDFLASKARPLMRKLQRELQAELHSQGCADVDNETSNRLMELELDAFTFAVEQASEMQDRCTGSDGKVTGNVYGKSGVVQVYMRLAMNAIDWIDQSKSNGDHRSSRIAASVAWILVLQMLGHMLYKGTHTFDARATMLMGGTRGCAPRLTITSDGEKDTDIVGTAGATARGEDPPHKKPKLPKEVKRLLTAVREAQGMTGDSAEWADFTRAVDLAIGREGGHCGVAEIWATMNQALERGAFEVEWAARTTTYSEAFAFHAGVILGCQTDGAATAKSPPRPRTGGSRVRASPVEGALGDIDDYNANTRVLMGPGGSAGISDGTRGFGSAGGDDNGAFAIGRTTAWAASATAAAVAACAAGADVHGNGESATDEGGASAGDRADAASAVHTTLRDLGTCPAFGSALSAEEHTQRLHETAVVLRRAMAPRASPTVPLLRQPAEGFQLTGEEEELALANLCGINAIAASDISGDEYGSGSDEDAGLESTTPCKDCAGAEELTAQDERACRDLDMGSKPPHLHCHHCDGVARVSEKGTCSICEICAADVLSHSTCSASEFTLVGAVSTVGTIDEAQQRVLHSCYFGVEWICAACTSKNGELHLACGTCNIGRRDDGDTSESDDGMPALVPLHSHHGSESDDDLPELTRGPDLCYGIFEWKCAGCAVINAPAAACCSRCFVDRDDDCEYYLSGDEELPSGAELLFDPGLDPSIDSDGWHGFADSEDESTLQFGGLRIGLGARYSSDPSPFAHKGGDADSDGVSPGYADSEGWDGAADVLEETRGVTGTDTVALQTESTCWMMTCEEVERSNGAQAQGVAAAAGTSRVPGGADAPVTCTMGPASTPQHRQQRQNDREQETVFSLPQYDGADDGSCDSSDDEAKEAAKPGAVGTAGARLALKLKLPLGKVEAQTHAGYGYAVAATPPAADDLAPRFNHQGGEQHGLRIGLGARYSSDPSPFAHKDGNADSDGVSNTAALPTPAGPHVQIGLPPLNGVQLQGFAAATSMPSAPAAVEATSTSPAVVPTEATPCPPDKARHKAPRLGAGQRRAKICAPRIEEGAAVFAEIAASPEEILWGNQYPVTTIVGADGASGADVTVFTLPPPSSPERSHLQIPTAEVLWRITSALSLNPKVGVAVAIGSTGESGAGTIGKRKRIDSDEDDEENTSGGSACSTGDVTSSVNEGGEGDTDEDASGGVGDATTESDTEMEEAPAVAPPSQATGPPDDVAGDSAAVTTLALSSPTAGNPQEDPASPDPAALAAALFQRASQAIGAVAGRAFGVGELVTARDTEGVGPYTAIVVSATVSTGYGVVFFDSEQNPSTWWVSGQAPFAPGDTRMSWEALILAALCIKDKALREVELSARVGEFHPDALPPDWSGFDELARTVGHHPGPRGEVGWSMANGWFFLGKPENCPAPPGRNKRKRGLHGADGTSKKGCAGLGEGSSSSDGASGPSQGGASGYKPCDSSPTPRDEVPAEGVSKYPFAASSLREKSHVFQQPVVGCGDEVDPTDLVHISSYGPPLVDRTANPGHSASVMVGRSSTDEPASTAGANVSATYVIGAVSTPVCPPLETPQELKRLCPVEEGSNEGDEVFEASERAGGAGGSGSAALSSEHVAEPPTAAVEPVMRLPVLDRRWFNEPPEEITREHVFAQPAPDQEPVSAELKTAHAIFKREVERNKGRALVDGVLPPCMGGTMFEWSVEGARVVPNKAYDCCSGWCNSPSAAACRLAKPTFEGYKLLSEDEKAVAMQRDRDLLAAEAATAFAVLDTLVHPVQELPMELPSYQTLSRQEEQLAVWVLERKERTAAGVPYSLPERYTFACLVLARCWRKAIAGPHFGDNERHLKSEQARVVASWEAESLEDGKEELTFGGWYQANMSAKKLRSAYRLHHIPESLYTRARKGNGSPHRWPGVPSLQHMTSQRLGDAPSATPQKGTPPPIQPHRTGESCKGIRCLGGVVEGKLGSLEDFENARAKLTRSGRDNGPGTSGFGRSRLLRAAVTTVQSLARGRAVRVSLQPTAGRAKHQSNGARSAAGRLRSSANGHPPPPPAREGEELSGAHRKRSAKDSANGVLPPLESLSSTSAGQAPCQHPSRGAGVPSHTILHPLLHLNSWDWLPQGAALGAQS
jgi:hypothetical protein